MSLPLQYMSFIKFSEHEKDLSSDSGVQRGTVFSRHVIINLNCVQGE